mmetsp:Transcript_7247/g.18793  ORF Transcript_7247/g.18793 Transcript_7247/m.18793 type:complete len:254 (-) Transcript_7247:1142-1903(-)
MRCEEVVQRGDISTANRRGPPAPGVVVVESQPPHLLNVEPLRKHDQVKLIFHHVAAQLLHLLRVELLLGVREDESRVAARVEARAGRPEVLDVEASVHEVVEEPVVVGVRMVAVPVENIRPHIEVVSWNVARGISDRVPHRKEDALLSWRCGDDAHSQWHLHRALLDLVRRRTGRRRRDDRERDGSRRTALECASLIFHANVKRKIPAPRPEQLGILERNVEHCATGVGGLEHRRILEHAGECHAIEHRRVHY